MRPGGLAEDEIRERAYQSRMVGIERTRQLRDELTAQKYLTERALIAAAPEQKPALLRILIDITARQILLRGAP